MATQQLDRRLSLAPRWRPAEMPCPVRRTVAFFPGSTIGNLEPAEAENFFRRISLLCGAGGGILIGVDLKKDRLTLERAYNDARGVTARFNLNLLTRINRSFGIAIRVAERDETFVVDPPGIEAGVCPISANLRKILQ